MDSTFDRLLSGVAAQGIEIAMLLPGSGVLALLPRDPREPEIHLAIGRDQVARYIEHLSQNVAWERTRHESRGVLHIGKCTAIVTLPPDSVTGGWPTLHIGMQTTQDIDRYYGDLEWFNDRVRSCGPGENANLLFRDGRRNHAEDRLDAHVAAQRLGLKIAPDDPTDVLTWRETWRRAAALRERLDVDEACYDYATLLQAAIDVLKTGSVIPQGSQLFTKRNRELQLSLEFERRRIAAIEARRMNVGQQAYNADALEVAIAAARQTCRLCTSGSAPVERLFRAIASVIEAIPCDERLRHRLRRRIAVLPRRLRKENSPLGRAAFALILDAALDVRLRLAGGPWQNAISDTVDRLYRHYDELKFGGDEAA